MSASSTAAETLKGEQIVYVNPGTRASVSAGARVTGSGSGSAQPPPSRSGTRFQISRPGCNSMLHKLADINTDLARHSRDVVGDIARVLGGSLVAALVDTT